MVNKINAKVKKIIKIGGSLGITLPIKFCKHTGLEQGDKVGVIFDHELLLKPWMNQNMKRVLYDLAKKE